MSNAEEVLATLRQIIRATDLYSHKLHKTLGLTTPQLMVLRTVAREGDVSLAALSRAVSLAAPTVTTILKRLEQRGFVTRERSALDRRVVHTRLTEAGVHAAKTAPPPLQDGFLAQFQTLAVWEQSMILAALQRVASMMNAGHLDAAPVLHLGAIERTESASLEDATDAFGA